MAPDQRSSGLFGRGVVFAVVMAAPLASAALFAPFLTRALGPTQYGLVAAVFSLNQLFVALALMGLDQAILVQRAEDGNSVKARGLLASAFVTAAATMTLALIALPWWTSVFGFENTGDLALLALAWTAPGATIGAMTTLMLAENRLKAFTAVSLLSSMGAQAVGLVVVLTVRPTSTVYVGGLVAVTLLAWVLGLYLARPRWSGLRDWATTRRAFALGLPMTLNAVAGYVLNAGDRILIQRQLDAAEVGRYQAAYTIGNVVVLVLFAIGQSWTPRFAEVRDVHARMALHASSRNSLYRLLVPTVLGVVLAAPAALRVLVPESFEPSTLSLVVAVIAVAAFPVAAGGASGRELITLRRGRAMAGATVTAAVLNVALNIVLLPVLGILGAAVATLISFVVQAGVKLVLLPREPGWPRTPNRLWALIGAACAVAVASTYVPDTPLLMGVRLALGVACLPWLWLELRRARG